MKSTLLHKHDIAVEFIDTAIKLYYEEKYCSSLHLAGAAEGIFHDTLKDKEIEPVKEKSSRLAQGLAYSFYKINQPSRASIERAMDYSKNSVKHVEKNGEFIYEVRMRPQIEAFRMIRRAIKNGRLADVSLCITANTFMTQNELEIHNA